MKDNFWKCGWQKFRASIRTEDPTNLEKTAHQEDRKEMKTQTFVALCIRKDFFYFYNNHHHCFWNFYFI